MAKRGKHEGSIRKTKTGWRGEIMTGYGLDGRRKRRYVYGSTRKIVQEKLTAIADELSGGNYAEPNKLTVQEWFTQWLKIKEPSVRENTIVSYQGIVQTHLLPYFGRYKLVKITPAIIAIWLDEMVASGCSRRTVSYAYSLLKQGMKEAFNRQIISNNPTDNVPMPKMQKKARNSSDAFTLEEQQAFEKAIIGHRMEIPFRLALATGLRRGELLGLTWNNIDFNKSILFVTQTLVMVGGNTALQPPKSESGRRTIPLPSPIVKMLKQHRESQQLHSETRKKNGKRWEDEDYLCTSTVGTPFNPRRLLREYKEVLNEAKLPNRSFHALRHTFATRGLEAGVNPRVMQAILGHADIATTLATYSHVLPDTKRTAMENIYSLSR